MIEDDVFLTIDVGTGSVRAALVDGRGKVLTIAAREHEQIVPQFGWSEQRPDEWWAGVVAAVRQVLSDAPDARSRIAAVSACGQMHGTVLVDDRGVLARETAPLWNDKRTVGHVEAFERKPISPTAPTRRRRPGLASSCNGCATGTPRPGAAPRRC